ncbi:hypothetical protein AVEN_239724-1 [Araneus ventricosus]|uniref:Uncharacterized protein n=1 Tax=Araneus ventricosus TaxID=182803 RepID=A0A4Y2L5A8_ARAVE|nr:hypothetical protein AVEN_239724-1 [Araneus ventricosus]
MPVTFTMVNSCVRPLDSLSPEIHNVTLLPLVFRFGSLLAQNAQQYTNNVFVDVARHQNIGATSWRYRKSSCDDGHISLRTLTKVAILVCSKLATNLT